MERLPDKAIIVLDDYHLIDAKPVHRCHQLPDRISAFNDPPGDFRAHRSTAAGLTAAGSGEVNEVRTSQLRFSKKEMTAFLNESDRF